MKYLILVLYFLLPGVQSFIMEPELVSTEEVVNALLEYLVGPRLPLKSSAVKEPPTLSQQQSVAKQVFFGFFPPFAGSLLPCILIAWCSF